MSDIQLSTIHRLEDASARGSPYFSHHTIEDNGNSSAGSSFSEDSATPRRTEEAVQEGDSTETQGRLQRWLVKIRSSNAAVLFAVSIALLTDMLVYGVVFPILPDYAISELGASPSEVGILFASYAFGLLGATPVFGVVSDKVGRKTPMLISLFGLIAATIVFGISRKYLDLFVARIAQGFSAAGSWVVGLALVADVFPVSQHGTAMGVVSSVNSFGLLVGPPFGGFLYDRFGYSVPFVICAVIAVIDLVLQYLIIPSDEEVRKRKEKSAYDQIRDGASPASPASPPTDATPVVPSSNSETKPLTLWTLLSYHEVLLALWLTVLYSSAFSGIEPVLPIHLYNLFRASPTVVGLIYFAIVIAYLLTSVFVGKVCDRVGAQPLMFMGALGLAVVSPLIALPQSMFLEIIALLLFGTAVAVIATPVMVHLSLFVDSHGGGAYAQIYALYLIAYSLGMMLGPLGAGFIMENVDFTWTCIFFSLLILTYFPVLFLPEIMECCRNLKRRLRGTPAEEALQTSPIEVVDSSSSNP